jgi:nitroreductase
LIFGHQKRDPIMELMEAIFGRRSVRDYLPDPVPQEAIIRLVDAAIHAPNAINQQPWSFIVIQERSLLDQISHDAKAHLLSIRPVAAMPAHLYERLADPDFHIFYHAPALIVISAIAQGPWIVEDCALAAENLMLAAHGAGFGSCWIGFAQAWFGTPKGKEMIGVPEPHVPVAPIIVGRPRTPAPAVPRKAPEVRWIG